MPPHDHASQRLERLRKYRVRKAPDLSLAFLKNQFQRDVAKPHKQLGQLVSLWQQLLPPDLLEHTRLEGLSRGTLRVAVDSSPHLYQLDRLLSAGLERQLVQQHAGPAFRRVKLRVAKPI